MTDINKFTIGGFIRVPSLILLFLVDERKFIADIAKNLDITYAYTSKVVTLLEEGKFITTANVGRKRYCKLTDKGLKISKLLLKTKNQFK